MEKADRGSSGLNIKQLSYFIALAQHGSISAAAQTLNMAQPSMSENIAKLEKQLDIELAIRGARGIQLTEAGTRLAQRGAEILAEIDNLVDELRDMAGEPRGPVTVGITPSLNVLIGVPLLETINAEYPEIRMSFSEGVSDDVLDWIANDRVDVGCVIDAPQSATFTIEPLMTEELFLVTAPDNWKGDFDANGIALEPLPAVRLAEFPLVLTSPAHAARKMQEKFARSLGIQFNVIAAIDSLPHISEMVARASAYTITSHSAVAKQVAEGRLALVPIVDPVLTRKAYLVRKRSRPVSKACSLVHDYIRVIIKEMVERYGITTARVEPAVASANPPRNQS